MEAKNQIISLKTLTDYHLETFIRCPYKFYYQFILRKNNGELKWRQMVQFSVNKTVCEYYRLPVKEQNKLNLLKLIEQNWLPINIGLFENKIHYYTILAKVTDRLLSFLTAEKTSQPPLFLHEKLQTSVDEISTNISLTFKVGEWSKNSFIIKKYLLEADESMVKLFNYLTIIFSYKAFGVLPEKIELLSLFDGKHHVFCPTEHDVAEGLIYLEFMKAHIQKPDHYLKTDLNQECTECSYKRHCDYNENQLVNKSNSITSFNTFMH